MASDNLIIQVDLEKGDVSGAFDGIEKEAKKSGKKSGKSFADSFSGSVKSIAKTAATATAAVGALATALAFKESISAAIKQEEAVNSLNTSLALAGTYSKSASANIQKFASDLQKTTTVGDESTLALFSLARNMTKTNEEAKRLTEGAIQLSAATGLNLESSVKNLGKTFSGLTGELGESLPAIKNFTAAQLKSGEALDFVLSRFGGAAEGKVNTFAGAISQLGNAFGDSLEEQGFFITKSPIVIKAVQALSKWFSNSAKATADFRKKSGDIFKPIIDGVIIVASFINKYLIAPFELAFKVISGVFNRISSAVGGFTNLIVTGFTKVRDFVKKVFNGIAGFVAKNSDAIQEFFGIAFDFVIKKANEFAVKFVEVTKKGIEFIKPFATTITGFLGGLFGETSGTFDSIIDTMINKFSTVLTFLRPILGKMGIDVDKVVGDIKTSMEGMIPEGDTFEEKFANLGGTFAKFKDIAADKIIALKEIIKASLADAVGTPMADKIQARLDELQTLVDGATGKAQEFKNNVAAEISRDFEGMGDVFGGVMSGMSADIFDATNGAMAQMKQANKVIGAFAKKTGLAMRQGIGQAAGSAFGEMGKALQQGKSEADAFGQAFVKSIGSLLVQQGTAFMLEGTAYAFSANPELSAKAGGLIASGAAMATFGGVLGASVSGGGSTGGGGGGSGGSGGTESDLGAAAIEDEDIERQTTSSININVEGSLVHDQELGKFIADVQSEINQKNGAVVVSPRFA